jgi:hypothetical protein
MSYRVRFGDNYWIKTIPKENATVTVAHQVMHEE